MMLEVGLGRLPVEHSSVTVTVVVVVVVADLGSPAAGGPCTQAPASQYIPGAHEARFHTEFMHRISPIAR